MKFIVDNQLPITLAKYFRDRGSACQHVLEANLAEAEDIEICRRAEAEDWIIVSKDEDFVYHCEATGGEIASHLGAVGQLPHTRTPCGIRAIMERN